MIPLLIVIDVIASLTLILFILLHAGRGRSWPASPTSTGPWSAGPASTPTSSP